MNEKASIIVVDDHIKIQETLSDILTEEGYEVDTAGTIGQARRAVTDKFYEIAMVDLKLPDGTGLDLVDHIKRSNKNTMVIIFTGYASLETAIEAMHKGAFGYLQKPLNIDEMKMIIKRALKIQELSEENENLIARFRTMSLKDPLTNLYNYRYLTERLAAEFKRAKRYVLPLSILMLDIDYFKAINDVYGHQYGDEILRAFGRYLKRICRENDIVVRFGGEEFVVLIPDTNKDGAIIFGQRVLEDMKARIFDQRGKRIRLKISAGIASFPEDGCDTETSLLDGADKALMEAKEAGGNRLAVLKGISARDVKDILKMGGQASVDRIKEKLFRMKARTEQVLLESMHVFAKEAAAKDYYTDKHFEGMVYIATEMGKRLGLSYEGLSDLRNAAILHDIGKIGVPEKILHKRERLSEGEYEKIKRHPEIGTEIVRSVYFLSGVLPLILYHHERFDGLGYSTGLKGDQIPLGARVLAVCDVYQAIISDRPYRKAYHKKEALKIIEAGSGTQFDPKVVKVFLQVASSNNRSSNDKDLKKNEE